MILINLPPDTASNPALPLSKTHAHPAWLFSFLASSDKPVIKISTPTAEEILRYQPPDQDGGLSSETPQQGRAGSARPNPPLSAVGSGIGDTDAGGAEGELVKLMRERRGKQAYDLARQRKQDEVRVSCEQAILNSSHNSAWTMIVL